jgi:hypothetical protein
MILRTTVSGRLTDRLEQLSNRQIEGFSNRLDGPQAGFLFALLKIGHEIFVNPGLLCKVYLTPAALRPQLPYPLPQGDTNVPCHHPIVGLQNELYPLYRMVERHPTARVELGLVHKFCRAGVGGRRSFGGTK